MIGCGDGMVWNVIDSLASHVYTLLGCVYSTLFMQGVMMGWIVVEFHVDDGEMWPYDDGCGSSCKKELN